MPRNPRSTFIDAPMFIPQPRLGTTRTARPIFASDAEHNERVRNLNAEILALSRERRLRQNLIDRQTPFSETFTVFHDLNPQRPVRNYTRERIHMRQHRTRH